MRHHALLLGVTASHLASTYASAAESMHEFKMIWSDDFSGSGSFNITKWQHYEGSITNGEQEVYPTNGTYCQLSGHGSLLITPEYSNGQWASCRIETIPSFTPPTGGQLVVQSRFKLGRPEVNHQGIWPAFWSLGESMRQGTPWPECGEIDTFENISGEPLGYSTLHCGSSCNGSTGLSRGTPFSYGDFHTWSHVIDLTHRNWTKQCITFFMDGKPYHAVRGADLNNQSDWSALAHKPMYMTLNVAVGGIWPGPASAATASGPASGMEVLYVAVYQSR